MNRIIRALDFQDNTSNRLKLFYWATQQKPVFWLDSNKYNLSYGSYDLLLALGSQSEIKLSSSHDLKKMDAFIDAQKDWLFGYISYDFFRDYYDLPKRSNVLSFEGLHFYQPQKIIVIKHNTIVFHYPRNDEEQIDLDYRAIKSLNPPPTETKLIDNGSFSEISQEKYVEDIHHLLGQISKGNIYEINYCDVYRLPVKIDNIHNLYWNINALNPMPFSAFFDNRKQSILSFSPERFMSKIDKRLISQPMKGTTYSAFSVSENNLLMESLKHNPKEVSENIMTVDLVRNDLSKIAMGGSVDVLDLLDVNRYSNVNQMCSTVACQLRSGLKMSEILEALFPMASMTGVPKYNAIRLIHSVESHSREIFSGTMGYIEPNGDFDFSVLIRSLFYSHSKNLLSFGVGSAITKASDPLKEFHECELKIKTIKEYILNSLYKVT